MPTQQLPSESVDPRQHNRCDTHQQYSLTCDQFEDLLVRSGGLCERCRSEPSTCDWGKLAIDHHATVGQWAVRGLLCTECNTNMRRIAVDDPALRRFINNSWYINQLDQLGIEVGVYPEPARGILLLDPRDRVWHRERDGWLLERAHHKSWGRFPVSWARLIYTYGPINLRTATR